MNRIEINEQREKSRKKNTVLFACIILLALCILLAGFFLLPLLSGNVSSYSENTISRGIEDAIYQGKTKYVADFSTASLKDADLKRDLNSFMQENYPASCLLEDISVSVDPGLFSSEATYFLDYEETAEGCGKIRNVSGEAQLAETLTEIMKTGAPKTPLILQDYEFSEEALSAITSEAEINVPTPAYEYRNIYYAFYEKVDGQQMVLLWGESPVEYPERVKANAELAIAVSQSVSEIKDTQPTDNTASYEAIFDLLCHRAAYDYDLADTSIDNPDGLTPEMLRDRTAYGALITGSTVCSGYARAFKYICDELNLPCYIVTGDCDGVRHAWNVVPIDGQRLYIDCTSADDGGFGSQLFLFTEAEGRALGYIMDESCNIPF